MIFKNINSEDISGLIICSEPPISSSAIRTKETTIDGRDGAIVEKLGYKTRIRNVEIGLKKDANVDKILSYFSGEGDLIFKNENDKVYKAAIYEQVDLERLLRLRKGSVAFYCQPFKYKRNDIFETIKDNKVKEKKGKHLELLNCAEQNVVDLKLEGSTKQATRSGKNLLDNTAITKISNGITFTVNSDGTVLADGTNDTTANSSLIINRYELSPGTYVLNGCPSGGAINTYRLVIQETNSYSILGSIDIGNGSGEFTIDTTTNVQTAIFIQKGLTVNNLLFKPMLRKATIADDTYEQYGASPSPDYPSPIENVEGTKKNKFSGFVKGIAINPTDGHQLADETRASSDYIAVDFNQNPNYYLSGLANTLQTFVAAYNSNKEFLGRTGASLISYFSLNSSLFTLGTAQGTGDIAYLRVTTYENTSAETTGAIDDVDNLETQLEEGTVATPYVPYNSLAVKVEGKNRANINKVTTANTSNWGVSVDGEILIIEHKNTYTNGTPILNLELNKGTYYLSLNENNGISLYVDNVYKTILYNNSSFVVEDGKKYALRFGNSRQSTLTYTNLMISNYQTEYEPYKSQVVTFPLGEEKLMEGSYLADDGIHHKRKQIVFDGSDDEDWTSYSTKNGLAYMIPILNVKQIISATIIADLYCDYYTKTRQDEIYDEKIDYGICQRVNQSQIIIRNKDILTLAEWKAWLSEHSITVEYELATEEIVPYTTAQQEAYNQLQKLKLYKGQNIMFSLEGSIINLKYLEDTDEKVENQGNIYSKPIIRLEKTVFKEVEIAINGIRFKYNFEEDDYVEIDCEEMTVQYEGLDRNRRLVIDFEFPKLKEGNNDIVMYSGDCIIKCKRKDRWL